MIRPADINFETRETARERRCDAEHEIRAISAVAEHFVRNQEVSGADALLMAIDLVRSVNSRTVAA